MLGAVWLAVFYVAAHLVLASSGLLLDPERRFVAAALVPTPAFVLDGDELLAHPYGWLAAFAAQAAGCVVLARLQLERARDLGVTGSAGGRSAMGAAG